MAPWLVWALVLVGLFVVGNIVVWFLPGYQRWLHRIEAEEAAALRAGQEKVVMALREAMLEIVARGSLDEGPPAVARRAQKRRCRVYPPVHRV